MYSAFEEDFTIKHTANDGRGVLDRVPEKEYNKPAKMKHNTPGE